MDDDAIDTSEIADKELARMLHIDTDNEDEIANAIIHKQGAEEYLLGAGVKKDYSFGLYKQLVLVLITRSIDRPDMLTKFQDMPGSGVVAMISQLRQTQALKAAIKNEGVAT